MPLIVVESPTKARTFNRILKDKDGDYEVFATVGHFRDIPSNALNIDYSQNFKPTYAISPLKEKIVGVAVGGRFKAYPFAMLPNGKSGITTDEFNGQSVRIEFNAALQTAFVTDVEGKPIPSATMYWFAWYAFHPETEIHGMPSKDNTAMSMSFHSTGMK